MAVLETLIDKQDNFEIGRDQIASILVLEVANQMSLATAAAKDPDLWKLRVFTEASNPWEQWLNITEATDLSPIINIWVDRGNFPKGKGDVVGRQANDVVYNIDCYGSAFSEDVIAGGHKPGDREAALEAHRAVRLVRNILMSSINRYLQLRGTVWGRWIDSFEVFQPQQDDQAVQNIVGARIKLAVTVNEFSPQVVPETLELLSVDVKRVEDGLVVLEADYEYPIV